MESTHLETILRTGLRALDLPEDSVSAMAQFAALLLERNRVMNLTAITDEAEVAALHFLDSAALLKAADFTNKSVVDVGTGAGFPGLPLRLAEPSLCLTLLDAQRKRIDFLREASSLLNLPDVACIHARAEEFGRTVDQEQEAQGGLFTGRERFDIAVSRAVASLPVLAELCLPLVRTDGLFLAMKSVNCEQEIMEASHALSILGGEIEQIYDYSIPGTEVSHRAVLIRKHCPTPEKYPRPYAKIKKRPL